MKKIWDGLTPHEFDELFKEQKSPKDSENENGKLYIYRVRLDVSKTEFTYRIRKYWNLIPEDIQKLPLPVFKKRVTEYIINNSATFIGQSRRFKHKIDFEDSPAPKRRKIQSQPKKTKENQLTKRVAGNVKKKNARK